MASATIKGVSGAIRHIEHGLLGAVLDTAGEMLGAVLERPSTLAGVIPGRLVFQLPKDTPIYEGEYEVTPSVYAAQTLETQGMVLRENVQIHQIPFAEVSNTSGGTTVTIGKET